jgi:hypothetical protein
MNAERRKRLGTLLAELEQIRSELEAIATDEREAFDNMAENLQGSDRGLSMEAAADTLDDAVGELETVAGTIEEVMES